MKAQELESEVKEEIKEDRRQQVKEILRFELTNVADCEEALRAAKERLALVLKTGLDDLLRTWGNSI